MENFKFIEEGYVNIGSNYIQIKQDSDFLELFDEVFEHEINHIQDLFSRGWLNWHEKKGYTYKLILE